MDIKGFIQVFNTKWSNTSLHYSKSAYSSYATDLVLCETWTNLSEHTRQLLQLTAKALPEGPFQSTALTFSPLYLNQITAAQHKGSRVTVLLGTQPKLNPPKQKQQQWPALHSPSLSGQGQRLHTASPLCSLNKTRAGTAQPARHQGAREIWAPLKRVFSQLSVKDKLEVNVDKLN